MNAGLRLAVAIPMGIFTGLLVTAIAEQAARSVWPVPSGFDPGDPVAVQAYVDSLSVASLMLVLAGWVAAILAGWAAAARVAGPGAATLAWVMGATVLVMALQTFAMIAHPVWFVGLSLVVLVATTALVAWLADRSVMGTVDSLD